MTSTDEGPMLEPGLWVRWTSQSYGSRYTKIGIILTHIPSGQDPPWTWRPNQVEARSKNRAFLEHMGSLLARQDVPVAYVKHEFGSSNPREVDSYVVAVPYGEHHTRWRLYWPRTHQLTVFVPDDEPYEAAKARLSPDGYEHADAPEVPSS